MMMVVAEQGDYVRNSHWTRQLRTTFNFKKQQLLLASRKGMGQLKAIVRRPDLNLDKL
jgi:hypothetical protein